jgi:hypothetical protein
MDVLLVVAVRARTEHRCEARAGARAQSLAPVLGDTHIGQADHLAIGKPQRAHVECVGAAVLAQCCVADPIEAAAFIGTGFVEAAQRRTKLERCRSNILA